MTTEEEFEKWWTAYNGSPITEYKERRLAEVAYLAATQRTAQRCVEICDTFALMLEEGAGPR